MGNDDGGDNCDRRYNPNKWRRNSRQNWHLSIYSSGTDMLFDFQRCNMIYYTFYGWLIKPFMIKAPYHPGWLFCDRHVIYSTQAYVHLISTKSYVNRISRMHLMAFKLHHLVPEVARYNKGRLLGYQLQYFSKIYTLLDTGEKYVFLDKNKKLWTVFCISFFVCEVLRALIANNKYDLVLVYFNHVNLRNSMDPRSATLDIDRSMFCDLPW